MRVFVTGASGYIGSALTKELIEHGHQVLGLARSDASAQKLRELGAEVQHGSLNDLESLKQGARACDATAHLAFIHDFSDYAGNCAKDREAIEAIGDALAGSDKPFIVTSGMTPGMVAGSHSAISTEDMPPNMENPMSSLRGASELAALALAEKGVRVMVVRLPPTVHSDSDKGFIKQLVDIARSKGVSAYVGDGTNRWSAVHRLDTARLYRLALEMGSPGAVYHAVADEGIPLKDIAETIAKGLGVPAASITPAEASASLGFVGMVVQAETPASSQKTREVLGWKPEQPGLLADIEKGTYF